MIRDDLKSIPPAHKGDLTLIPGGGVEFSLGTAEQRPCFVEYGMHHAAREFYVLVPLQFPFGYTFSCNKVPSGLEHKLLCVFTDDGMGRILVKLRGGGGSPELTIYFEGCGLGDDVRSGFGWPADGAYHVLEVLVERTGSPQDRVQVWLDGRVRIDARCRTCGPIPSPINAVQIGAYRNQDCPLTQSFRIGGGAPIVIDDHRPSAVATPPIVVPPRPPVVPSEYELIAREMEKLAQAQMKLAARVRALEPTRR